MTNQDERIEKIIRLFKKNLSENGFDRILDCIECPGGIIVVERKDILKKKMDDANAFIEIAKEGQGSRHPYWKIFLIKEEVNKMDDRDILHTLAHEISHILLSDETKWYSDLHILSEQACDTLADKYFGFPKKDKIHGYIH